MNITRRTVLGAIGTSAGVGLGLGRPLLVPDPADAAALSVPQKSTTVYKMVAAPGQVAPGGQASEAWLFDGLLPGPSVGVTAGDMLRVTTSNQLSEQFGVHWHGLTAPRAMDAPPIAVGDASTSSVRVQRPGTYFYQAAGLAGDHGLAGALVVYDSEDPLRYFYDVDNASTVVVLDDWLGATTPEQALASLRAHGERPAPVPGDGFSPPDVAYSANLINGRAGASPAVLDVRHGRRYRLRLINSSACTVFQVSIDNHPLTVIAADGTAVKPVVVKRLRIGMGERFDVVLAANQSVGGDYPIRAEVEGVPGESGQAVLHYAGDPSTQRPPTPSTTPADRGYSFLTPLELARSRTPNIVFGIHLTRLPGEYAWGMDVDGLAGDADIVVKRNQIVRFDVHNDTKSLQVLHLPGHRFTLATDQLTNLNKDTVRIEPGETAAITWGADNPGLWALTSQNPYRAACGMQRQLQVK